MLPHQLFFGLDQDIKLHNSWRCNCHDNNPWLPHAVFERINEVPETLYERKVKGIQELRSWLALGYPLQGLEGLYVLALGCDKAEWCQIRVCISTLLPFRVQLAAWTTKLREPCWRLVELSAGSPDNENRKNKTLLTRGAFDSFLRGHSWLSCESPPQKYCKCYSFGKASSASWKQSRELSSSGQWGWQHGHSHAGNEGRDKKEHGFEIALVHAVAGDWHCREGRGYSLPRSGAVDSLCSSCKNWADFWLCVFGGYDDSCETGTKRKGAELGGMHKNSFHPTPLHLLLGRVREQL